MYFITEIYVFNLQNSCKIGDGKFFLWSPLSDFNRILGKIFKKNYDK